MFELKLLVVKFWKYLLACLEDIFVYRIYWNARWEFFLKFGA